MKHPRRVAERAAETEFPGRLLAKGVFVSALLWLLVFVGSCFVDQSFETDSRAFAGDEWAAADPTSGVRMSMLDDLLRNHLRIGRSLVELEQLLGPPDMRRRNDAFPYPAYVIGTFDLSWMEQDRACVLMLKPDVDGNLAALWSPALPGHWWPREP